MFKNALKKPLVEFIGGILLIAVFMAPFLSFASGRHDIYVDGSKKGAETGSTSKPYHTISEALVRANDHTNVHIAKGTYEDNIEIPKGVRIFGSSASDVVIKAKSHKRVVVSMKDKTQINKVTIENGNEGIWIKKDAEVSIIKCVVKNNEKDGIKIESGSTKKDNAVNITDSVITENGRAGIFSRKRRVVLINNEISNNDSDGVDIAAGSSAWIEENRIKNNDGSGLKLTLDGSDIWTKSNSYRSNGHDGIEVNAYGAYGRIDVNKSRFVDNKHYGVVRIARVPVYGSVWNGLTFQANNVFEQTNQGAISGVLRIN